MPAAAANGGKPPDWPTSRATFTMNPDKQRIAIAESCVQTMSCCRCREPAQVFKYGAPFCSDKCAERCGDFQLGDGQLSIPDYLNDLNAMHEAEKVLTDEQVWVYTAKLRDVLGVGGGKVMGRINEWEWHATAAQRAEAFLRTIGKWEHAK